MSVMAKRAEAVAETVAQIRRIEQTKGVNPDALASIKSTLIALAERSELFPPEHFPVAAKQHGMVYRLAEDPDHRYALYASAGVPGKAQPPHNHTTWAVIAGVYGDEHNVFYERIDNRAVAGEGSIRKTGELTVRRGSAVQFMPDDFHTIEVRGDKPSLHLHMYGLSLEHLPERIFFSSSTGGAYAVFPASPNIVSPVVGAAELRAMLIDGEELALLDVREEGVFAKRHLLFAAPLPVSTLELRIDALVPRRSTRIVLCDDGDGLAHRAAGRLMHFGYHNVSVLQGGVAAWAAAGFELFSGMHVPSKAFGEFIEHHADTPRISATELQAKLAAKEDLIILDSRPMNEYRAMSIPGGIDCPGAELVYRINDLVKSPDTLVVVNCAGRTRSIIGAQSLINAALPNKVVALQNGTMGWELAGLTLEHGQSRSAPAPTSQGLAKAKAAADRVARRFGVRSIDRQDLERFRGEQERRTLYLFDVRSPEEYLAGHLPGSRSAPGGQLVQATDAYVGTRNARLVLIDDTGVRARMTASWLLQMGWDEVFVLDGALQEVALKTGPEPSRVLGLDEAAATLIAADALQARLAAGGALVVDLNSSLAYRKAHIPGAWFAVRSRLKTSIGKLPPAAALVLTSPDGALARLAAPELAQLSKVPVLVLQGGTAAWKAAGFALASGGEHMADANDDVWYKPYDHAAGVEAAMKEYLSWEIDLVQQIERDGGCRFRTFPDR